MTAPVILCAGTWGLQRVHDLDAPAPMLPWWHPRSLFGEAARGHGIELVDDREPFLWATSLDGIRGDNLGWYAGGAALRYFAHVKCPPTDTGDRRPVSIIAHSHGGQVALYAAAQGLVIATLVTVGTPVRLEMETVAAHAAPNIRRWIHVYSDADGVQIAGAVGDGRFGMYRQFRMAANVLEPGAGHSELHDAERWTRRSWWKQFFGAAA